MCSVPNKQHKVVLYFKSSSTDSGAACSVVGWLCASDSNILITSLPFFGLVVCLPRRTHTQHILFFGLLPLPHDMSLSSPHSLFRSSYCKPTRVGCSSPDTKYINGGVFLPPGIFLGRVDNLRMCAPLFLRDIL